MKAKKDSTIRQLLALPPLLLSLQPFFSRQDQPIYLVGGAVRDLLLGRAIKDLDFVVPGGAIKLAFKVGDHLGLPAYALDRERDAGRVVLKDEATTLDFTRLRGLELEADLRDRDFTINALALPAGGIDAAAIVDPCGGLADLSQGLIRLTHSSAVADDPVRSLRAVRLSLELRFSLIPETAAAIREAAPLLAGGSVERSRDELFKMLHSDSSHLALRYLADLDLLPVILPEIASLYSIQQSAPHHEPVFEHTVSVLERLSLVEAALLDGNPPAGDPRLAHVSELLGLYSQQLTAHLRRRVAGDLDGQLLLRLGALFHDVGKSQTQQIEPDGRIRFIGHDKVGADLTRVALQRLKMSREAIKHVSHIVAGHMRPLYLAQSASFGRRAIYRFFRDSGTAGLDIGLLTLADHLATYEQALDDTEWLRLLNVVQRLYEYYFEHHEQTIRPDPLLSGNEIMEELQLLPGPEIGRLLRFVEEAQAAGEISTSEQALALARDALERNLLE